MKSGEDRPKRSWPEDTDTDDPAPVEYATTEADATTSEQTKLFDITCVIGSVYSGGDGKLNPREAAFVLIARHSDQRPLETYTFPEHDGSLTTVTVHLTNPNR